MLQNVTYIWSLSRVESQHLAEKIPDGEWDLVPLRWVHVEGNCILIFTHHTRILKDSVLGEISEQQCEKADTQRIDISSHGIVLLTRLQISHLRSHIGKSPSSRKALGLLALSIQPNLDVEATDVRLTWFRTFTLHGLVHTFDLVREIKCGTKITNSDIEIVIEHNVLKLQVKVSHTLLVHELNCVQYLTEMELGYVFRKSGLVLQVIDKHSLGSVLQLVVWYWLFLLIFVLDYTFRLNSVCFHYIRMVLQLIHGYPLPFKDLLPFLIFPDSVELISSQGLNCREVSVL